MRELIFSTLSCTKLTNFVIQTFQSTTPKFDGNFRRHESSNFSLILPAGPLRVALNLYFGCDSRATAVHILFCATYSSNFFPTVTSVVALSGIVWPILNATVLNTKKSYSILQLSRDEFIFEGYRLKLCYFTVHFSWCLVCVCLLFLSCSRHLSGNRDGQGSFAASPLLENQIQMWWCIYSVHHIR